MKYPWAEAKSCPFTPIPGVDVNANADREGVEAMRNLVLCIGLIAGLLWPVAASHGQTTNTVTATCKDGTTFTGTKRAGACRGHGGVQSWNSPGGAATNPTAAPSQPQTTAGQRTAPGPGGAGQVWVNTATKVYHCPGTRWYGKTKQGSYMSEAQAQAQGARPDHGKACSS